VDNQKETGLESKSEKCQGKEYTTIREKKRILILGWFFIPLILLATQVIAGPMLNQHVLANVPNDPTPSYNLCSPSSTTSNCTSCHTEALINATYTCEWCHDGTFASAPSYPLLNTTLNITFTKHHTGQQKPCDQAECHYSDSDTRYLNITWLNMTTQCSPCHNSAATNYTATWDGKKCDKCHPFDPTQPMIAMKNKNFGLLLLTILTSPTAFVFVRYLLH
jgi:hypothetical protein